MHGYNYQRKESTEDQLLWERIRADDKNALGTLFDIYSKELLTYGYRLSGDLSLTKDAIQDVFVDVWLYRNNLSEQVQVKFYLYRCLRRAIIKQKTDEQILLTDLTDAERFMDTESSAETEWLSAESEKYQSNRILALLNLLSDREREVISLKYYSDLKIREIASLLDLKEQTVANTLQNALTRLRKHLIYFLILCELFPENFF